MSINQRAQVADLGALARDEAKFFQSLSQKGPNVLFAVGDTYARRDFSPAERGEPGSFVGFWCSMTPSITIESECAGAVMAM